MFPTGISRGLRGSQGVPYPPPCPACGRLGTWRAAMARKCIRIGRAGPWQRWCWVGCSISRPAEDAASWCHVTKGREIQHGQFCSICLIRKTSLGMLFTLGPFPQENIQYHFPPNLFILQVIHKTDTIYRALLSFSQHSSDRSIFSVT